MTYGPPPQQPWTDPHGRTWPGGPPPVEPPKGAGPAVAALVLSLFGFVVWALPINLDGIRAYSPFPFAVPGLVLAIVALTGHRRGKPIAAIALIPCVLALGIGLLMTARVL